MEIKYTTDGKKVVVLGNLNSKESIVQEIFVSENGEIPSGDNFVCSNLHDEPVISWKEKENKKIQQAHREWESKLEGVRNQYYDERQKLELFVKSYRKTLAFLKNEKLDQALGILSGDYKYLVVDNGFRLDIRELEKWVIKEEYHPRKTSLRLLGLFGDSEKSLKLQLTEYGDGSGSSRYDCEPFATLEEAKKYLVERIIKDIDEDKKAYEWHINLKEKYSLPVPSVELVIEYYDSKIGEKAKVIADRKKEIERLEKEIKDIELKAEL